MSRWLDPKDFKRPDEEMEPCCRAGEGKCPYPSMDLGHPDGGGFCRACSDYIDNHGTPCPGRPVLPPSPLSPAPRWRTFEKWEGPEKIWWTGLALWLSTNGMHRYNPSTLPRVLRVKDGSYHTAEWVLQ